MKWDFFIFYGIVVFPLGFTDERRHIDDKGCFSGKKKKEDGKKGLKVALMSKNGGIKKEKIEGRKKKREMRNRVKSKRSNEKFDVTFSQ